MKKKIAERHNEGKLPMHYALIFKDAMEEVARVSAYGENKYSRYNFVASHPASESVSSALRHLFAWWHGEENDDESACGHLAHFAWNALRLCDQAANGKLIDDRPESEGRSDADDGEDPDTIPICDFIDLYEASYMHVMGPTGLREDYLSGHISREKAVVEFGSRWYNFYRSLPRTDIVGRLLDRWTERSGDPSEESESDGPKVYPYR